MVKNKVFYTILALFLLTLTACSGGGESTAGSSNSDGDAGSSGSQEKVKLVATSASAPVHGWNEGFFTPWMEQVESETNGLVEFEFFPSGELVEIPHEYDGLTQGIADVVSLPAIYNPSTFPMSEITMLPLSYSDTYIASEAFKNLLESDVELQDGKTFYDLEFGDKGLKVFPLPTTMEYSISTTGKEFNSVEDVKGSTLRAASRIHEMYAKNIGINTITMPAVDMFDAMSRGAFDGSFYSIADWSGYGFQDLFKYTFTAVNFGHFNSLIAMTQDRWDSLPKEAQDAIIKASEDQFKPGADEWEKRGDEMVEYSLANGGKVVDDADPAVIEHLESGIVKTWNDYIKILEDQGLPGKELVKLWRDLIIEAGGKVPDGVMEIK